MDYQDVNAYLQNVSLPAPERIDYRLRFGDRCHDFAAERFAARGAGNVTFLV
jgi:hypothetical protein